MTLQEAIQSGRPFRRESWAEGFTAMVQGGLIIYKQSPSTRVDLTATCILAEDWVFEPQVVEFECCWYTDAYIYPSGLHLTDILRPFIGLKTKVRMEVI